MSGCRTSSFWAAVPPVLQPRWRRHKVPRCTGHCAGAQPEAGQKLLATGNGRCNLDNTGIAPELYFTADPAALRPLLDAVNAADPLRWFRALGLYTPHRRGGPGVSVLQSGGGRAGPAGAPPCAAPCAAAHRLHRAHPEPEPQRLRRAVRDGRGLCRNAARRCRHLRHGRRGRAAVRHRRLWHPVRRPVRRQGWSRCIPA